MSVTVGLGRAGSLTWANILGGSGWVWGRLMALALICALTASGCRSSKIVKGRGGLLLPVRSSLLTDWRTWVRISCCRGEYGGVSASLVGEWPGTWRPGAACREPVKTGSKPYAGARAWSESARRVGAGQSSTGCHRGRGRKARGRPVSPRVVIRRPRPPKCAASGDPGPEWLAATSDRLCAHARQGLASARP